MTIADVAKLDIPFQFGCDDECMETSAIEDVYDQLDNSVETKYGASKFVILSDNWNEVIKIPFNGSFDWEQDDDNEDGGEYHFNEFITKDYCALEAAIYADAVALGVADFFAGTKYAGMTNDGITPYYVSERVYTFYDKEGRKNSKTASEDNWNKAKKLKSALSKEWLALAIEWYGDAAVNDLLAFIDLENIYDLHSDNIGFRANGAPVVLDYSGFDS